MSARAWRRRRNKRPMAGRITWLFELSPGVHKIHWHRITRAERARDRRLASLRRRIARP